MNNDFIVCNQPHKVKYAMVRVYTNTIVHCIHNALRCMHSTSCCRLDTVCVYIQFKDTATIITHAVVTTI